MATPPPIGFDIVTVASAAAGVAPTALAAAIATLQVVTAASRERVVGAVVCTTMGATAATRPHPPVGPPFITVTVSAPTGPTVGIVGTLAATAIVGASHALLRAPSLTTLWPAFPSSPPA
jgi:hypothetical protein